MGSQRHNERESERSNLGRGPAPRLARDTLRPTPHSERPQMPRRLLQLYVGLVLFGFSVALVVLSSLGNAPWDVLHQGLSRQVGLGTGTWAIIVGAVVLLLWIPLRQRPG